MHPSHCSGNGRKSEAVQDVAAETLEFLPLGRLRAPPAIPRERPFCGVTGIVRLAIMTRVSHYASR